MSHNWLRKKTIKAMIDCFFFNSIKCCAEHIYPVSFTLDEKPCSGLFLRFISLQQILICNSFVQYILIVCVFFMYSF